jgi:hypothetical protein
MVAKGRRRAVSVVCIFLVFGAVAVEAPAASATPASFIAGKLASGAGEAVMGKLMAQAGLDPTANALSEISAQLTQLSNQIKELKGTSDKTLREVLDASFAGRYDLLEISTITKFEEDYVCYLDPRKALATRETCRARFKRQAPSAQLGTATDKFNDLLTNPKTTIVEAYAKSLVGTRPFYTVEDQKKVTDFFTYLEDMEVMATTLTVEAENVIAAGEGPQAVKEVWEVSKLEAETLSRRRAVQIARNPAAPIPGPLDTVQKLWLNPSARGFRDYWSAAQVSGAWRLPTEPELLAMVKDRGDRTVRRYLIDEAAMGTTFANVPEVGESGEFWTSTEYPSCMWILGTTCHLTVSTNNAYVRAKPTPQGSTEPRYYSFQVAELSAHDRSRYGFLFK